MAKLTNLPQIDLVATKVHLMGTGDLTPHPKTARIHPALQISNIAANIRAYGFVLPIVIGSDGQVLAGHARLEAARQLGMDQVPVVSQAHLSDEDQRAFMLADNKLCEASKWDESVLKAELIDLAPLELKLSLIDIGFTTAEIDKALAVGFGGGAEPPPPHVDPVAISRIGDVWLMDGHRLVCGDATRPDAYAALMLQGEKARMVFTDPPYNVPIAGFVAGRNADRREFPMASGEMNEAEFCDFLMHSLSFCDNHLMDGGIAYVCMDWRHITEVVEAGETAIGELKNVCVWTKPNAGMGSFYRGQHEMVFVFKKGTAAHVNNFGLGEVRYRTNVWQYAGASGFHPGREDDLAMHPTAKPVLMIADAIMDVSHRGDIVLDPFAGSGSTLMAAMKTGRVARLVELDPLYVDVIVRRFQREGGGEVFLEDGVLSFDEVAHARAGTGPILAKALQLEGPR